MGWREAVRGALEEGGRLRREERTRRAVEVLRRAVEARMMRRRRLERAEGARAAGAQAEDDAVMRDTEDAQEMGEDAGDEDGGISMTDGSAHEDEDAAGAS